MSGDTVVVTGAGGFLGSMVVKALRRRGERARAIVRPGGSRVRGDLSKVLSVEVDLASIDDLRRSRALEGARGVIHCAGMIGSFGAPDAAYRKANVEALRATLTSAFEFGVGRVLHVSSPGVLGPIDGAPADEEAPLNPGNAYERSKAEAERLLEALPPDQRSRVVVVRPEFLYGPSDDHVAGLFRAIQRGFFFYVGRGAALCHPTYEDDAVAGVLAAFDHGQGGRTYHVAGPRPVSIRAFAEAIAAAYGARPPWLQLPVGPMRVAARGVEAVASLLKAKPPLTRATIEFFSQNRQFSTLRATSELGFTSRVDIEEGTRRTAAAYRKMGTR